MSPMTPGIRSVAAGLLCLLVLACGSDPTPVPATESPPSAPSSPPSAAATSSPAAATEPRPPACAEATLAFDPGTETTLLLNCVDQLDTASIEQVWSWDGTAWTLVDDGGPPATVVAGVAFDPERNAAVRYGGLPMDGNDCTTETWEWRPAGWAQIEADPPTA